MIGRMVRVVAFVIAAAVATAAHAQTFVAPAAVGVDREEVMQRLTLPSLVTMRQAFADITTAQAEQADLSADKLVVQASDARAEIDAADASWLSQGLKRANRTVIRERSRFREQLDLAAVNPNLLDPETPVGEAVLLAALANDSATFARFVGAADPEERPLLVRRKDALLSRVAAAQADRTVTARVFADGTIRGTAEGTEAPEGVGTGALAVSLDHGNRLWYASLTIASTEDTLTDNFGAALLAPGAGKALASGLISVMYHDVLASGLAVHPYLSSARHLWSVKDTTRSATVLGFGILFRRDLGTQRVGGKDVSLAAEIGPTSRFLGGDILSLSDTSRVDGIGTDETAFFGVEGGATLSVGDLVGSVQLYYMFGDNDDRVLGLSNLQLVAGFSVKGELFRPADR